jgi:hypothetical protein
MLSRAVNLFVLAASVAVAQKVEVVMADPVYFPGVADSNSPIHWSGGKRYVYNSDGLPIRSEGVELGSMRYARATHIDDPSVSPW